MALRLSRQLIDLKRMLWLLGVVLSVARAGLVMSTPTEGDEGQIWAVLVAGSNGYDNYRHQADVCHAYQIFHRHGIPDSNIIVMMYDDIAYHERNPKKGKIFNKPGGPNVYGPKEVPKDYIKDNVTPDNFIKVLTGEGSGKVLKSGPNDNVFIYFADHGATGLIGFPSELLAADDLIKALKTMYNKKMYKRLVFYMEACESGSMFNKILPNNINIFATTAANPYESSWACYYDDTLQTCLGDQYSVAWMEDVDSVEHQSNATTETLKTQFQHVVERVNQSHPSMWGDTTFQMDLVIDYIGKSQNYTSNRNIQRETSVFQDSVSSRDVLIHTLNRKLQLAKSAEEKEVLQKERDALLQGRKEVDELFARVLRRVSDNDGSWKMIEQERQPLSLEMMPCYRTLVDGFNSQCVNINKNTYALGHLYKLANLCAREDADTAEVLEALKSECGAAHRGLVGVN